MTEDLSTQEVAAGNEQILRHVLHLAAEGVDTDGAGNIFRELVRHLAVALDVDHALIGVLNQEPRDTVNVVAGYFFRQFNDGFDYDLKDTPCANVIGQQFRYYPERVRELFADPHIHELETQGYAGIPLFDSRGQVLGLMAVADRKPLVDERLTEDLLRIFSVRAAIELERRLAEQARNAKEAELHRSEDRLRATRYAAEQQRQQLEQQLRQAQKMEAIGQLTGGIAHDFNNILTAMSGYVVLAGELAQQIGNDRLSRYLDRAQRSGERARDLIQQMLTFSRGQHGEPRPVSLAPLVREWIGLLETTLPSSMEIHTDLAQGAGQVLVDPLHMEQVLMNLCINARDAMQGQGTLTVALREVTLPDVACASCRQPVTGRFVELSVADSGEGVAAEVQERMFEPFFSTKAVGHGSGMGLSIVHGILHEHGGHLLLDSRPGQGAVLRVLLPLLDDRREVPAGDETSLQDSNTQPLEARLLLVDDEPAVSEFMQDLLESWGLEVKVFNSSVEARAHFSEDPGRYDMAIVDQTMPKMTGLELSRHLAGLRPDFPVILYTGYSEEIDSGKAGEPGVCGVINKPVDSARLYELVRRHLAGC